MNLTRIYYLFGFLFGCIFCRAQPLSAINPQNQSTIVNLNVAFQWNSAPNTINYKVTLSSNASFTANYSESPLLATTNWSNIVSNPGQYFWRVISYTANDSTVSPTYSFTNFSPANSINTSLWLKADAGILLDATNKVQQWNDLSNNGYLITQNNALKRPTVVTNAVNGYPSLAFNGTQFLSGGDILDLGFNSRAFFVIGKMASANQSLIAKSRAFNATFRYGIIKDGANTAFLFQSDNNTSNYNPFNTNNYALYNAFVNRNTAKNHFDVNNSSLGVNSFNSNLLFESTYRFLIGAYNNANDDGEVLMLSGNICEIIFSDTYDSTEILKVKNYLKYKYTNPLTLGSDLYLNNTFCAQPLTASAGFSNYLWSNGSTSMTTSVSQSGHYWVRATDAFGFVWSDTIYVEFPTINPPPSTSICAYGSINWNTGLGPGFSHLWNDGSTNNNITINQPGNYSVTVTGTGGCSYSTGNIAFTIDPYPITTYIGQDTNLCAGNTLSLQIGANQTVQYTWSNGSTGSTFPISNLGSYPVSVTTLNANGCLAQDTILITVNGTAPTISYQANSSGCSNANFQFNDQSYVPAPSSIISQTWSFSNGMITTGNSIQINFPSAGFYQGELEVISTGNCISRDTFSFNVYLPPALSIFHAGHCSNESISFTAADSMGSTLYNHHWQYNQGAATDTASNPNHFFFSSGQQSCQLIAENINGCVDTLLYFLSLDAAPMANMDAPSFGCELTEIEFNNLSTPLDTFTLLNQTWTFGDGTLSDESNPYHIYSDDGTYELTLVSLSSNGCSDTNFQNITIHPTPDLSWNIGPSCKDNPTAFLSTSTISTGTIDSTFWLVNLQFPIEGTSGSYTFTTLGGQYLNLNAVSNQGCERDTLIWVEVNPGLTSGFSYSPGIIVAGTPLTLISSATGNTSLEWSINQIPSGVNDTIVFLIDSTYSNDSIYITCTTLNAFGCVDSTHAIITIENQILDLAISNVYISNQGNASVIGAAIMNNGTLPIDGFELTLNITGDPLLSNWINQSIAPGETFYYVFPSNFDLSYTTQNQMGDFLCVRGITTSYGSIVEEYYSNNEACKVLEEQSYEVIPIHPNPVNESINLGIVAAKNLTLTIEIYNSLGQKIKEVASNQSLAQGLHYFSIPTTEICYGNYWIYIDDSETKRILKFLKSN